MRNRRAKSWSRLWIQPCLAWFKTLEHGETGGANNEANTHGSEYACRRRSPRIYENSELEKRDRQIMRIALLGSGISLRHYNLLRMYTPVPQALTMANDEVRSRKKGCRSKGTERRKDRSFCYADGHLPHQELTRCFRSTVRQKWRPQELWMWVQGYQDAQDKQWMQNLLISEVKNGGRSSIAETSHVRVSRHLNTSTTTQVAQIMVQH